MEERDPDPDLLLALALLAFLAGPLYLLPILPLFFVSV
jgi:hypothetical protein